MRATKNAEVTFNIGIYVFNDLGCDHWFSIFTIVKIWFPTQFGNIVGMGKVGLQYFLLFECMLCIAGL